MKKSLLAAAVLSAFAGIASAQTNVTIYGVADAAITRFDNGASTVTRMDSGQQSGSRIGFKGSEDLGGGLSAIFAIENGFSIDDGALSNGLLFGRQAWVGLNSGVGTVKLGRQYIPLRVAVDTVDPFGLGLAGRADLVMEVYGERSNNTINYTSPNLGGFTAQAAYSLGEVAGDESIGRQAGLSLGYAAGPVNVVAAYHDRNLTSGTETIVDAGNSNTAFVGGTYDLGILKLHAAYGVTKAEDAAGAKTADHDNAMLGVSASFGASRVLASYMRRSNDFTADADTDAFALGYTYSLSKRTNLYTSYLHVKNDAGANLGSASATGLDPNKFNVGIRHTF